MAVGGATSGSSVVPQAVTNAPKASTTNSANSLFNTRFHFAPTLAQSASSLMRFSSRITAPSGIPSLSIIWSASSI